MFRLLITEQTKQKNKTKKQNKKNKTKKKDKNKTTKEKKDNCINLASVSLFFDM